jgi:hypothetical protein
MKSDKVKYLVMISTDKEPENYSVVNPFWETTAVCNTVKKSYQIGIWLAEVLEPDHTYRKTADLIREKGVVYIADKSNPEEVRVVISKVKKY